MSSLDRIAAVFDGLKQSFEAGRLAHAYVVVGSPRGDGLALAESLLQLVFCSSKKKPCGACDGCAKVKARRHPDILWVEPESKSRRITIDQVRDDLQPRIAQTSYEGGWKAGVLVHADRLTDEAANSFLKTLEEPPGRSLLLLLTDAVQHLLPTILSRCQRLVLSAGQDLIEDEWREKLMGLLREGPAADVVTSARQSARFKALLDEVKKSVVAAEKACGDGEEEDEDTVEARIAARVLDVRTRILRCMLLWRRDVLMLVMGLREDALHFRDEVEVLKREASGLSYGAAMGRLRGIEEMARKLERKLPEEASFETCWSRTPPAVRTGF